ncbi:phage protein Gp36 family protein [Rathayibacter sp. Leaf248]|uniref:phage protein Gp36 family protein n=1 Tax=Rathayibacter sp. Leaf248 TaxID=2876555 RepID=UPI001E421C0F|nr:phage protein Gp36 family protein [Rathayibacter sp. Leaf248]
MATTLKIQSFVESNIRERGELAATALAGATSISVRSAEGFEVGHTIYVGALSREGCERVVVASATDPTVLSLLTPLTLNQPQFEPVTSVVGDLIHIYRAANIDGSVPADDFFTVLATRNIDPDQLSSYYTDAGGSSAFWDRSTYYNATTNDETALSNSEPVRGDDFGHYATIAAIRSEAGFGQAHNLSDLDVDQQRRAAETEINTALAGAYTVPFKPVPDAVRVLTVKLAAAMLLTNAYGDGNPYGQRLKDARAATQTFATSASAITDEDGTSLTTNEGVSSDFGDEPRMFTVRQRW